MSRETSLGQQDTLFPGVFDDYVHVRREAIVTVTEESVRKIIHAAAADEMPREFQIQCTLSFENLPPSHSGIVSLSDLSRATDPDFPVCAVWTGIMAKCPVTLDQILPLLKLMIDSNTVAENELLAHIQYAIFSSFLRMLATFEKANIVHGDLKPENIGLAPDQDMAQHNGAQSAFDFGVSKSVGEASIMPFGTRGYIAPEVLGGGVASAALDIYSMGCVMRTLMDGERPAASMRKGECEVFRAFMQGSNDYIEQRNGELGRLNAEHMSIYEAVLIQRKAFCEAVSQCGDFKSCLRLVIAGMCATLPEYRPVLSSLQFAREKLSALMPPLQEGYSVAAFFQQAMRNVLGKERELFFAHDRKPMSGWTP